MGYERKSSLLLRRLQGKQCAKGMAYYTFGEGNRQRRGEFTDN